MKYNALSPLALYLIMRFFEKRTTRTLVLLALLNIVISFYEFRAWYILALLEILAVFFYSLCRRQNGFTQFLLRVIPPLFSIGSVFIVNLYWLISFSRSSTLTSNQFFDRGLFGDSFLSINNALTLFHPFWTGKESSLFIVQKVPPYFWIVPIAAFLGLYLNRKNKHVLFFGLVAIIGIMLTKQSSIPFQNMYKFLYDHLPGFNAFREASKFFFYIALGYSILIASFVKYLSEETNSSQILYKSRKLIIGILVVLFLLNLKPIMTNELGTLFIPRTVPNDYLIYKSFIKSQNGFSRSMWIPRDSRWSYYSKNNPSFSLVTLFPNGYFSDVNKEQLEFIQTEDFKQLLDLTSTKYIVIPLEDTTNDDNFFDFYSDRKTYLQTIAKLKYLNKLNIGTKSIVIYEYSGYRNHIYSDLGSVSYVQIKPYMYEVNLSNISKLTRLSFSESYHPGWKIYMGKLGIADSFLSKNYLESNNMATSDMFQDNSFVIDPEKIKRELGNEGYTTNTDGSINLKLTIFFRPQIYIFIGLGVSAAFIFGALLLSIILRRQRK